MKKKNTLYWEGDRGKAKNKAQEPVYIQKRNGGSFGWRVDGKGGLYSGYTPDKGSEMKEHIVFRKEGS